MKFTSKLKRALRILFEPNDKPDDNTIYQLDPDNFGSFLPVRPIVNAPFEKPRHFLIYEVGFDINCSEQEAIGRFRDSLDELFSLLAHDITRNICNCLGPEKETEHEVRFPITIKLDLDQSVWDFMLKGEAYDVGLWLKDRKAPDTLCPWQKIQHRDIEGASTISTSLSAIVRKNLEEKKQYE